MFDIAPDSTGNRFRAARIALLRSLIDAALSEKSTCRVLDIGGTYDFWHVWREEIDWSRTEVVCVNRNPAHAASSQAQSRVTMVQGSACHLEGIGDMSFDVAFSNSVIEHVGLWGDMQAMAREVRRVAPRYLVQTPNYWFPIEPHARTPFLHWLPEPWACRIVMARKCGFWPKAATMSEAVATVQSARLIDHAQMCALFEDADVRRERFLGFTKSLIAVKGAL